MKQLISERTCTFYFEVKTAHVEKLMVSDLFKKETKHVELCHHWQQCSNIKPRPSDPKTLGVCSSLEPSSSAATPLWGGGGNLNVGMEEGEMNSEMRVSLRVDNHRRISGH